MFKLEWNVPYEGSYSEWVSTLEGVKTLVKENCYRFDRSYDDLTILEIAREIDVYLLMKEG
jgi:hypothetical protein